MKNYREIFKESIDAADRKSLSEYIEFDLTEKHFNLNLLGKRVEFYSEDHYLNNTPYGYTSHWYPAYLEGITIIEDYYGFIGVMKSFEYEFALEFPTENIVSKKIRIKNEIFQRY
jgi:hypothetical protein